MKLTFFGDFVCQNPNTTTIGQDLKNHLTESDYNVINFEAPVRLNQDTPIHKSGPNICQPISSIQWLENNNFNIISLANNHLLDFGPDTAKFTKESFNNSKTFGLGDNNTAYSPLLVKKDNIQIGLIALTHHEFSCVEDYDYGCAWMSSPRVLQEILQCRDSVDYLFIYNHGGLEYFELPLPQYRSLYRSWIDLGADAIIASHPHVPQGWEIYNGKPIFYSLGNFLFEKTDNIYPQNWNYSIGVEFELNGHDIEFKVIPIMYDSDKKIVDVDESKEIWDKLNLLNENLRTPDKYSTNLALKMQNIAIEYDWMLNASRYSKIGVNKNFIKSIAKYILRWPHDSIHHLNMYRCETHRWVMEFLLLHNLL